MRILKTPNEFIDIISSMTGRKFVTFGYVCGANLNLPQGKRVNPKTGRMVKCNDMKAFGELLGVDNEIAGILKLSRYNLRFMNREDFTKAYGEFNKKFDDLKIKYNYPEANRKSDGKYTETKEFGKGIEVYKGNRDELQGRTYTRQDINGAKVTSKYYLIDDNGLICREYTKLDLTDYLKDMHLPEPGVIAMRKLGREEAEIQEYIKEFNQIKMIPKSFEYNHILYMAGTVNNEKFLYINDSITNTIKDVECEIDINLFIQIAQDLYKDSFIELNQYANDNNVVSDALQIFENKIKNKDMDNKALYESIMKNVAKEVKKALNEGEYFDYEEESMYPSSAELNMPANDLYRSFGSDGQYMIDCYDGAYEYFFLDFALFCKHTSPETLKAFINYHKNYIS